MAVLLTLAMPSALAAAGVRSAESVLPPGQSGFVPPDEGTENPHLTDQVALFESFAFKPAGFDQPGSVESPRAGVTITRDAYGVPNVRAGSADDAWFGVGYAVAQDRLVELELFRRSTRGRLAEVLGEGRLASDIVARRDFYTPAELRAQIRGLPAALRARFESYAGGRQRLDRPRRGRPVAAPARVRAARAGPGAVDGARLRGDRRAARPHGALRRRARARELARAARARGQALRAAAAAAAAGTPVDRARVGGALPVPARPQPQRRAPRLQGLAALLGGPQAAEGRERGGDRGGPAAGARRLVPLRASAARATPPRCSPPRSWASRSPSCSSSTRSTRPASTCAASPAPASPSSPRATTAASRGASRAGSATTTTSTSSGSPARSATATRAGRGRCPAATRPSRCPAPRASSAGSAGRCTARCRPAAAAARTRAATRSGAASCRRSSASPRSTTRARWARPAPRRRS